MADRNVGVADAVFTENSLDLIMINVRQCDGACDGDSTLVLLAHCDGRWFLVEPDTKALQFVLDDRLVAKRLQDVKYDKNGLQVRATEETLSVSLANGRVVTRTSDDYRRPA